jgi:hypothetical protein
MQAFRAAARRAAMERAARRDRVSEPVKGVGNERRRPGALESKRDDRHHNNW